MKKFLLISHGHFADGILDSLKHIMGNVEGIETLCAYTDPSMDFAAEAARYVEGIGSEEELIVVSDLFGGSVNNEFMRYIGKPGFHLVAGLNLSLLIELVNNRDMETHEMIALAVDISRDAIKCCDDLLKSAAPNAPSQSKKEQ